MMYTQLMSVYVLNSCLCIHFSQFNWMGKSGCGFSILSKIQCNGVVT